MSDQPGSPRAEELPRDKARLRHQMHINLEQALNEAQPATQIGAPEQTDRYTAVYYLGGEGRWSGMDPGRQQEKEP